MGAVFAERSEIFDEDSADLVVGVQLADAVGLLIPKRAQDLSRLGVGIGTGTASHHIFGGNGLREDVAVDRVHRDNPAGGNRHPWSVVTFFRPENRPHRRGGRGGDVEALLVENIAVAGGIRHRRAPGDFDGPGRIRKHDFGVRTIIIAG